MTIDDLNRLVAHPEELGAHTLDPIEKLLQAYPYAHTIVFLYLYNLALLKDVRFSSELKKWAALLPNREKLYFLVEMRVPYSRFSEEEQTDSFSLIDKFLSGLEEEGGVFDSELSFESIAATGDYFSIKEGDSFENLHLGNLHLGDNETATTFSAQPFWDKKVNSQVENRQDVAAFNTGDSLFTETLAGIYIKQGRYDKAYQMLEALQQNNSEQRQYFALQMNFLKKLIENDKHNNS